MFLCFIALWRKPSQARSTQPHFVCNINYTVSAAFVHFWIECLQSPHTSNLLIHKMSVACTALCRVPTVSIKFCKATASPRRDYPWWIAPAAPQLNFDTYHNLRLHHPTTHPLHTRNLLPSHCRIHRSCHNISVSTCNDLISIVVYIYRPYPYQFLHLQCPNFNCYTLCFCSCGCSPNAAMSAQGLLLQIVPQCQHLCVLLPWSLIWSVSTKMLKPGSPLGKATAVASFLGSSRRNLVKKAKQLTTHCTLSESLVLNLRVVCCRVVLQGLAWTPLVSQSASSCFAQMLN